MVSGFIIFGIFKIKTNNRSKKFFLISDNNLNKLSINSNNDELIKTISDNIIKLFSCNSLMRLCFFPLVFG